ncbi:hypothetical protein P8605_15445 [Streptomyces sp. T-3]|nr:hypothetical protein [Streptomyces sp. T-3]
MNSIRALRRTGVALTVLAVALLGAAPAPTGDGAELFAPGTVSSADRHEWRITFTADGRTAYFSRSSGLFPHESFTILVTHKGPDGSWSQPRTAPFSGTYPDIDPVVSPDGRRLFFASTRPAADGRTDSGIWYVEKRSGGRWSEPRFVGGDVNSPHGELYPSLAADGTLYFGSDRPGGAGSWDLYRARPRKDGTYGPAENLGASVNSPGLDFNPEILRDGRTLVFASWQRPDQTGGPDAGSDLYVAHARRDGGWSEPRHLGPAVNSEKWEYHPTVTAGGRWLYFVRQEATNDFYRVRGEVLRP